MQDMIEKIASASTLAELENIKVSILGKKGILTLEFAKLKDLQGEEKKEFANGLNKARDEFNEAYQVKLKELEEKALNEKMKQDVQDFSFFDETSNAGALHPIMQTMDKIIEYFTALNFSIEKGPLIEDDFHNFEALNLPQNHPARDMQDTFYFENKTLLRSQTSPVQIRTMLAQQPPIRMIAPGAVFRRDFDITHTPMFHQVEGLVVEEGDKVNFANLKDILEHFLKHMFGDVKVRFRPSFFPFTEPSAEVDISCVFCKGCGCRVCKHTGWLEVLGCGVVDPNVYKFVGYKNVSGYAFGLGVERFAMLLHKIPDLRSMFEGDLRLLEQFR
ncbi:phenylalanyl-tRNA synthetase, alpha subunit [Campylobacter subantarcticus LMG 24377]|uniref:Phenylalanine--tRNA ligase alpha subunit n=2 Tax=Campylobacter subantarcticus TaxID=497724 RepID=A0A0A8HAT6_9BACT|nr:phenylalanine--tRNA ligase subunit alpha [Campylobacter subantarcticus]EAJ1261414.1 phenylalanine--tRNA ligase subunit alpha [Campylobacter lari]AJC91201.1 phenylalanyl-tRNA synthetase, alpha subunit [Campylobacter subantarcticus LMG 24374]AJC92975.1 phenylalanyl-tRNA synthetase, alpha subunit [Campylobacter subantarcticus LMG 24377]EAL3938869.1 phenylalanine--tRNA ligase subunit alpha [Campylobacter lari]MPB99793.1 phenylalanine--tRNA ligase subunit alpha [Campylobacter subantarcticus]